MVFHKAKLLSVCVPCLFLKVFAARVSKSMRLTILMFVLISRAHFPEFLFRWLDGWWMLPFSIVKSLAFIYKCVFVFQAYVCVCVIWSAAAAAAAITPSAGETERVSSHLKSRIWTNLSVAKYRKRIGSERGPTLSQKIMYWNFYHSAQLLSFAAVFVNARTDIISK